MSTRDLAALALALVVGGCAGAGVTAGTTEGPNLGREATPAQVAGWDISVGPDGAGLPPGKGTPSAGALVYEQKCQACHGARGAGQPNDRLVGGQGTLASKAPVKTIGSYWPYATTVFDYVRRAMPYMQPQTLSNDEVYALTAYLLNLNGIIGDSDEMSAQTLPKVTMPNQSNFIVVYPPRAK
ncbi:MAG: cytochrome C [Candidatus Rokuibacteriota bacterium]|nr:MAG: cytochrome C [Candidatus Rokubacteria bacterium]